MDLSKRKRMGRAVSRRRPTQKKSRYQAFHSGLNVFGVGMTIGCAILMFGFVVLQLIEHFMRR